MGYLELIPHMSFSYKVLGQQFHPHRVDIRSIRLEKVSENRKYMDDEWRFDELGWIRMIYRPTRHQTHHLISYPLFISYLQLVYFLF